MEHSTRTKGIAEMGQQTLLDHDVCRAGHDITDKDKSLRLYEYRGRVLLRCRKCASERASRYYNENIRGKVSAGFGKSKAERKAERAKNDSKPRTPSVVKTDALTLALLKELNTIAIRLTDTELMALVLTLREKQK